MCKRMRGLTREEKAFEISKEVLLYGALVGGVVLMHTLLGNWVLACFATAGGLGTAFITVSVLWRRPTMAREGGVVGMNRIAVPAPPRSGVLLVPGAQHRGVTADGRAAGATVDLDETEREES